MISRLRRWYQPHAAIFPTGVPEGYDIIISAGQSNAFYGLTKDNGLDVSDARIYQYYYGGAGTANTVSTSSANDPLDHPDTSGVAGPAIGHTVHFAKDYYIANGDLLGPRKVLIVPTAYGNTRVSNTGVNGWGAKNAKGGAVAVGTLLTAVVTRTAAAIAETGTNTVVALDWHQIEGDFNGYSTFQKGIIAKYRWQLLCALKYLRDNLGSGNFPIMLGRPTPWSLATGDGVNYIPANMVEGDKILRAMARRLPNVGIADSTGLADDSSIHFNATAQRAFAEQYYAAYEAAVANTNYPTSPTWDDIDYVTTAAGYTAGFTVSGIDLSGDANSAWKTAIATMPNSTGKVYVEIKAQAVASATNLGYIGLCNQDYVCIDAIYLGQGATTSGRDEAGAGIWGLAGQPSAVVGAADSPWVLRTGTTLVGNIAVNDRMMFALDRTAGKIWVGRNGTWLNSGDPAAGTNEWVSGVPTTDLVFIAGSIYTGTGNTWRIQAKASEQSYSPPSGFSAWGT